jgi:hypothetical protein
VSTVRHHAGDRHARFLADFLGNSAIAFPICPLMLQKYAFRYFGPTCFWFSGFDMSQAASKHALSTATMATGHLSLIDRVASAKE